MDGNLNFGSISTSMMNTSSSISKVVVYIFHRGEEDGGFYFKKKEDGGSSPLLPTFFFKKMRIAINISTSWLEEAEVWSQLEDLCSIPRWSEFT
jgi:hypothetical protein